MSYFCPRGGCAHTCRCISKADAEDAIEISGIGKASAASDVGRSRPRLCIRRLAAQRSMAVGSGDLFY